MRAFTTLRSQFVAVVAAAVILSNLAVVAILEVGREGELQQVPVVSPGPVLGVDPNGFHTACPCHRDRRAG